jgi:acetolactate synthase-1/2/3 large subunit
MAEALGCHGEYVEQPSEIRRALERAFGSGVPAVVNVKTDHRARATTTAFTNYMT